MEIYKAKLKHDKGTVILTAASQGGAREAIRQITALERCPECAIIDIVKIDKPTKQ